MSQEPFFVVVCGEDCLVEQQPDVSRKLDASLPVTHGRHSMLVNCWWAECPPSSLNGVGVLPSLLGSCSHFPRVATQLSQACAI